jgi:tetratricopeptide (TPR) repeat protein
MYRDPVLVMKRICALLVAVGIAVACCVLVSPVTSTASAKAPGPCAYPDALAKAGATNAAKNAYQTVIKANPAQTCAIEGLTKLDASPPPSTYRCADADTALRKGHVDEAATAYLKLDPTLDCVKTGLADVRTAQNGCAEGDVERKLHRHDDAEAAYKAALDKSPGLPCARDGLNDLGSTGFGRFVSAVVDNIPIALEVLGLFIVLGLLALLPARSARVRRRYLKIPFVRRLISRQLSFAAFDESALGDKKWGNLVVARMQHAITRMRADALSSNNLQGLDIGRADDDFFNITSGGGDLKKALDSASQVNDHTKTVGAILDALYALLPAQRFQVGGVLSTPEGEAGATLNLQLNGQVQATTAITQVRKDPSGDVTSADFERLAGPSAVWLQFHLARASHPGIVTPAEAQSYALNRQGQDFQLAGEFAKAAEAYKRARELEPKNWAARLNLAVVLTRLGQHAAAQWVMVEAIADMQALES